jgi:hypothetical protein
VSGDKNLEVSRSSPIFQVADVRAAEVPELTFRLHLVSTAPVHEALPTLSHILTFTRAFPPFKESSMGRWHILSTQEKLLVLGLIIQAVDLLK